MQVTDLFGCKAEEVELELSGKAAVLNCEHGLKLYADNALLHSFCCSPSHLGELCVGWLVSEGYGFDTVEVSPDGQAIAVLNSTVSSLPEKLSPTRKVTATTEEMLALFYEASDKYSRSHGVHECVIKGDGWHILRTDIGRHNAMDKAIGAAILAGYDLTGAVMFSSGRINVQTVEKAIRCGIATLMSKATVTHEALQLAKERNLKVFFSVKED